MKLLVEGKELYPPSVILRESLLENSLTLEFTMDRPLLFETCTLQMADEFEFVPLQIKQSTRDTYTYVCYPKGYVDFLQMVTEPVNMTGDLQELMDKLSACKCDVVNPTQPQHWIYASMRGKTIMDKLTSEVLYTNGGCPTAHFSIAGILICLDILAQCSSNIAGSATGNLESGYSSTLSQNHVPSRVRFNFFDNDTFAQQEQVYTESAGYGNSYKYVAHQDRKQAAMARYQSQFWRRYVSNSLMSFSEMMCSSLVPGAKYVFQGSDREYICVAVTSEAYSSGARVFGSFFPCINPQQTL